MSSSRTASSVATGRRLLLSASLAFPLAACGGSPQILTPTPQPVVTQTQPPSVTSTTTLGWIVSIQTTAVSGPAFCIVTPSVGNAGQEDYEVVRHGDTVSFVPQDPYDWDSFTATISGSTFTATNGPLDSGPMCTHYRQSSTLTGAFSADNNSFTAVETWRFTLDSGDVKTVTFSWSGTRR